MESISVQSFFVTAGVAWLGNMLKDGLVTKRKSEPKKRQNRLYYEEIVW